MFFTKKINKEVVSIVYDSPAIYLRNSGKQYYGTEVPVIRIENNEIHVNKENAEKFGIKVVVDC